MYLFTVEYERWKSVPKEKRKQLLKETGRSVHSEAGKYSEAWVAEDIKDVLGKIDNLINDPDVEIEKIQRHCPVLGVIEKEEE
jgi:hypothetical protein